MPEYIYPDEIVGVSHEDLLEEGFEFDAGTKRVKLPEGWAARRSLAIYDHMGNLRGTFRSTLVWQHSNAPKVP